MVVHRQWVAGSVEARVIYLPSRTTVRLRIGEGVGQLNGGFDETFPAEMVPNDLLRPNAVFWFSR
jgi:hypothetical protein